MKQYLYIEAFTKFAELFALMEFGEAEVDIRAIASYIDSDRFVIRDSFDIRTSEDCYDLIESMILDGFPIWNFLKISDWSKNMLTLEFEDKLKKEEENLKKKYKCYQNCKFFEEKETGLGMINKCNYKKEEQARHLRSFRPFNSREGFELKKKCNYYESKLPLDQ